MNKTNRPTFFLIDGSALVYRSYFAFIRNPLINSRGENTSAVYGFTRMLLKIIGEERPDYLGVAFDTAQPTFRHQAFEAYKANRPQMPQEMLPQFPRIKEIITAYGIPIIEMPGFEADDVMGTLAKKAELAGWQTYLVTGDKDFMQLVTPQTWIYNLKKANEPPEILDATGVIAKMSVPPEKIVELLSLVGDTADNVPGAKGVGPQNALELLTQFGDVDTILKNSHQITKKKIRESIEQNRDLILLSRNLVQIDTQTPIAIALETFKYQPGDQTRLLALFKDLEFHTLIDHLKLQTEAIKFTPKILETLTQVEELVQELTRVGHFTIDLETTHIEPLLAEIVGLAFCHTPGQPYYIPVRPAAHEPTLSLFSTADEYQPLDTHAVLSRLKPLIENPQIKKCGQNIKYDALVLTNYGIEVQGIDFDTMVASYVLNPEKRQHNLDGLALEYFNYKKIPTTDLIGKGKNQITMAEVPINTVASYACEDADMTQRLEVLLRPKLRAQSLMELYEQLELPLISVLIGMERAGIAVDVQFLEQMAPQLEASMHQIIKRIEQEAGVSINLNSPKQMAELLFERLKLPPVKKTKTGYSTDVTVLEELAKKYELARIILDYRQLAKLQSTYVTALPKLINPRTRRIHTSFNQTVTVTGRLSSSNPNLQNIPIRSELGREIRRAFIAGDRDHLLVDADYSQIELRIMAHLAQDQTLRAAFQNDEDIHQRTAALIFNVAPEAVTPEQRRRAKTINFGIIYGMGDYGLANRLDISQTEAQAFITAYFQTYPGVKNYMETIVVEARKNGYVTTLLGRRRILPDILSDNRRTREFAERTAINTPIQGTAADLIKVAMINLHRRLQMEKMRTRMILQVHDELVFEVPVEELEAARNLIRAEMEGAVKLAVPIKVEIGVGSNWLAAHA
ncbi:DNA polymerase I [candidate division KSB1 bacterium]|nr:DNA polymerase I [candidate division KSB1 bacterium]